MPVLKILPASHIIRNIAITSKTIEARISKLLTFEPAEIRKGITKGDMGGTSDNTLANTPSGL